MKEKRAGCFVARAVRGVARADVDKISPERLCAMYCDSRCLIGTDFLGPWPARRSVVKGRLKTTMSTPD